MENAAAKARDLIYGNIDAIMNNAQKLQAEQTVALTTLLNPTFMQAHTKLKSIEEMFAIAGHGEASEEALDAIPDFVWQDIVQKYTDYENWDAMFTAASQSFVRSRLLEGIEDAKAL